MAAGTLLYIKHGTETVGTIVQELIPTATNAQDVMVRLSNYFSALGIASDGRLLIGVEDVTSGSLATATATITHANLTANDTITIAGVVLTWVASAANENEITIGADATADAAALAAAINVHSKLKQILTATSALGVTTITSLIPGLFGTFFTLATSNGTAMAFSSAALAGVTSTFSQSVVSISRGV